MRNPSSLIQCSIAAAIVSCLAGPAHALEISLWDFDGNNDPSATTLSAGTFTGNEDGSVGVGPYQLLQQGLLETINGSKRKNIEDDLGLGKNRIKNLFKTYVSKAGHSKSKDKDVKRGSAFQLTFDALAGDVLEFDWNMLTSEIDPGPPLDTGDDSYKFTDFSWYDLTGADTAEGALADVYSGPFSALTGGSYDFHTGQQLHQITLTTGGTYTITVGVNDVKDEDDFRASALVIDFFRLQRGPEPGTFGTVAGGLLALAWLSWRRQHPRS